MWTSFWRSCGKTCNRVTAGLTSGVAWIGSAGVVGYVNNDFAKSYESSSEVIKDILIAFGETIPVPIVVLISTLLILDCLQTRRSAPAEASENYGSVQMAVRSP